MIPTKRKAESFPTKPLIINKLKQEEKKITLLLKNSTSRIGVFRPSCVLSVKTVQKANFPKASAQWKQPEKATQLPQKLNKKIKE